MKKTVLRIFLLSLLVLISCEEEKTWFDEDFEVKLRDNDNIEHPYTIEANRDATALITYDGRNPTMDDYDASYGLQSGVEARFNPGILGTQPFNLYAYTDKGKTFSIENETVYTTYIEASWDGLDIDIPGAGYTFVAEKYFGSALGDQKFEGKFKVKSACTMKVEMTNGSGTFKIAYASDTGTKYDIESFDNKSINANDQFIIYAIQGSYWGEGTSFNAKISFE
jgi:hypothetical protein